MRFELMLAA